MQEIQNQDDDLLLQLKTEKHKEKAFTKIYKKYYNTVFREAYYILRDVGEAKDSTQQVFIDFWGKADTISIRKSLRAYLIQSIRYGCVRKKKMDAKHPTTDVDDLVLAFDSTEDYVQKEEQYKVLNELLETLPEKMRNALKMIYYDGDSLEKAAEKSGVSINTIRAQLQTGTKKIFSKFKKYFRED